MDPDWCVGVDLPDDARDVGLELLREDGRELVGVDIRDLFLLASSLALCSSTYAVGSNLFLGVLLLPLSTDEFLEDAPDGGRFDCDEVILE